MSFLYVIILIILLVVVYDNLQGKSAISERQALKQSRSDSKLVVLVNYKIKHPEANIENEKCRRKDNSGNFVHMPSSLLKINVIYNRCHWRSLQKKIFFLIKILFFQVCL